MDNTRAKQIGQKTLVFVLSLLFAFGLLFSFKTSTVNAAASVSFKWTSKWNSNGAGNFTITVGGLKKDYNVKIKVDFAAAGDVTIWDGKYKKTKVPGSTTAYYISFKSTGTSASIGGQAQGKGIAKSNAKVNVVNVVTPSPKPAATTKQTSKKPPANTTKQAAKKKSSTKKSSSKKTSSKKTVRRASSVKKVVVKTTTTTTATETSNTAPVVPAFAGGNETTESFDPTEPSDAGTPVEANLAHNNIQKNKKSFAWLGFVLVLIVAGLSYLRVRSLKNQGKKGKDIALDFIPGVGDLLYAISGSTQKYEPIASDTQHGYMRNTAASKKELKMLEEQEKRAEQAASKTTTMHKRPKELSVNHAAVSSAPSTPAASVAPAAGSAPAPAPAANAAAAAVVAGGITSRDNNANKPASPFKPVEGAAPVAKPVSPFKPSTQQNSNGAIMTSAFKPSAGAHNPSDKIVSSAFKPSSGAHNPSDKIVSSALKQTQKFTPQKGPAAVTHSDNDAVKLARERAEAAREQQAMREAMKAQKAAPAAPAPAAKAEAKPAHAPIKRPSAFSVNRAAAIAAGTVEASKPASNAPAAPATPAAPMKSGASLGVGASAAAAKTGPVISPARAKASSNSNQLGNLLNGRANNSGRAPVWADPSTAAISPFKQSAQAQEEAKAEAAREAERKAAMEAEAPKASYADQAKTHKSAFFSRSSAIKGNQSSGDVSNAYGGIVRPTGVIGEGERKQQIQNAAMGTVLEGQKPAILDPDSHKAPTAVEPVFGFKPVDPENYGT